MGSHQVETGLAVIQDRQWWGKIEKQLVRMMDKGIRVQPEQILMAALFSIKNSTKLQQCSQFSLAQAVIETGLYGLQPASALGQSFLVPLNEKGKGMTANLWIGYRGFNTLAARVGLSINAHLVYSEDKFDIDFGRSQPIIHKPFIDRGDKPTERGHVIGGYAFVETPNGVLVRWHDRKEMDRRRRCSRATGPDSPWQKFPEAMMEKGPRRDLGSKDIAHDMAPRLVEAAQVDERREFNVVDAEPSEVEQKAHEAASAVTPEPEATDAEPADLQDVTGKLTNCVKRGKSCFCSIDGKEFPIDSGVFDAALKRQGKNVKANVIDGKIVSTEER